eukprot:scaffold76703_cov18-Tisochrysis_lutea.AAC.1
MEVQNNAAAHYNAEAPNEGPQKRWTQGPLPIHPKSPGPPKVSWSTLCQLTWLEVIAGWESKEILAEARPSWFTLLPLFACTHQARSTCEAHRRSTFGNLLDHSPAALFSTSICLKAA